MFRKLFHKDVFMPDGVPAICNNLQARLDSYDMSHHIIEHLTNQRWEDRSHTYDERQVMKCLDSLKNSPQEAFEVEASKDYHYFRKGGWFVTKYCCRIPYSTTQDLVVVIRPQYHGGKYAGSKVTTAWMNGRTDSHRTLDKTKYCSREEWDEVERR